MDGETFSQRLRRLRLARGLSQEALGQASGTTRQSVFDVERGKTGMPQPSTLYVWAQALGVTPHYLEKGYDLPPSGYADWQDVPFEVYMRNTSELSEPEIEALRVVVEGVILRARMEREREHGGDHGNDRATTGGDGD